MSDQITQEEMDLAVVALAKTIIINQGRGEVKILFGKTYSPPGADAMVQITFTEVGNDLICYEYIVYNRRYTGLIHKKELI